MIPIRVRFVPPLKGEPDPTMQPRKEQAEDAQLELHEYGEGLRLATSNRSTRFTLEFGERSQMQSQEERADRRRTS